MDNKKIKVVVSRENGKPICLMDDKPSAMYMDDKAPFMVIKKDRGTVESQCGDFFNLLEFVNDELEKMEPEKRRDYLKCFSWGVDD